ncbi:hypothetical protein SSX86_028140 [Deinandra increscens subsp. villosa]|uniref:BHLH domain-containing protein n=1 Tax=Deinandra increscens subsp. villosa TaxID=3103831 RepID=A0AAP0CA82_9ASTR
MLDNPDMFEAAAAACFDPNSISHHQQLLINPHDLSNFHQIPNFSAIEPPPDHLHHQHLINMEIENNNQNHHQQFNWNHNLQDHNLLNSFQLPKCSSSICFSNPGQPDPVAPGQIMYDPVLPLNIRELVNCLPNGFNLAGCGSGFGEMDMERGEQRSQFYDEGDAVFEFGGGSSNGRGRDNKDGKHFATEKQRRLQLNGKFEALRSLIPNPTKADRASIVGDAIEYINKLKCTLEELKVLVDRKRCNRGRMKKHKTEDDSTLDVESIYTRSNGGNTGHDQQAYNGNSTSTMKSSWLQRKSKNAEIDVRIIDDEVTIKLVQQKRINCLLLVSKVLDEFNLDLHHVAGGQIGDFYSYLFNNKICEGSSVYASAIANKLMEVMDKQYATIPLTSGY